MYLIDSNIVIYSFLGQYEYIKNVLYNEQVYVSAISRIEVLGYSKISNEEELFFNRFFQLTPIIYPNKEIFNIAIRIRRRYNLKLGDSIIAATALFRDLTLYTRNIKDFNKIENLKIIDPVR